jgi:hypothetical protein
VSKRSKLLNFPNQDRQQEQAVQEFSGAMLHRLRAQDHWFTWEPTEQEMLFALAKAWENIKQAQQKQDRKAVQEFSADLANLAMKCFKQYGK